MKQNPSELIAQNVYVGAWDIAKAPLTPYDEVANTLDKLRNDRVVTESPLNAVVLSEAFGLVVEKSEDGLEKDALVRQGFTDQYGSVKTSVPDLLGTNVAQAHQVMRDKVQVLAEHLGYKNALLVAYRDDRPRTDSEGLELWQYMAAMSDEDIRLNTGRLASRNTVELSYQFAGEDLPTIIEGVHYDDRAAETRLLMSMDFGAKQSQDDGRRILMGNLGSVRKHRTAAQLVAAGLNLSPSHYMQGLSRRLREMSAITAPLDVLEYEQGMEDALEGMRTMKAGPIALVDTDHAYYDSDIYDITHWEAYRSKVSRHKLIAVSIIPHRGDPKTSEWRDSATGYNSTFHYSAK